MNRPLKIILLVLTLSFGLQAAAQENPLFSKATEAYNKGRYDEAISYYEQILESGSHSAAVYFNLGNSYYKKNEIAPSIYYYEKALLLEPGDPETLNNLRFAQNMTLDAITPLPQTDLQRFYKPGWLGLCGNLLCIAVRGCIPVLFGERYPQPETNRAHYKSDIPHAGRGLHCALLPAVPGVPERPAGHNLCQGNPGPV